MPDAWYMPQWVRMRMRHAIQFPVTGVSTDIFWGKMTPGRVDSMSLSEPATELITHTRLCAAQSAVIAVAKEAQISHANQAPKSQNEAKRK